MDCNKCNVPIQIVIGKVVSEDCIYNSALLKVFTVNDYGVKARMKSVERKSFIFRLTDFGHTLIIIVSEEITVMARPRQCRRVGCLPGSEYFKPRGIPLSTLEEVILAVDEFEAIRLADLDGLYQEQAAEKMGISRQTFGRIIESAHKKVAEALVEGKALKIEGGKFEMAAMRKFKCSDCHNTWELSYGTGRPENCPSCKSGNICRAEEDRGSARGLGRGQGRCSRGTQKKQ